MKDIVVIATSPGRANWIFDLMKSLTTPSIVVSDFGFELGKIRWVVDNIACDRFLFLQDSVVVRNEKCIEILFETPGSSCIMCDPQCFGSYMGVYEMKVLRQMEIPTVTSKEDSIFHEIDWTQRYIKNAASINHPLNIRHTIVETIRRHDRENRVYINHFYEKWKGDWGHPVLEDSYANCDEKNESIVLLNQLEDVTRHLHKMYNQFDELEAQIQKENSFKFLVLKIIGKLLGKIKKKQ